VGHGEVCLGPRLRRDQREYLRLWLLRAGHTGWPGELGAPVAAKFVQSCRIADASCCCAAVSTPGYGLAGWAGRTGTAARIRGLRRSRSCPGPGTARGRSATTVYTTQGPLRARGAAHPAAGTPLAGTPPGSKDACGNGQVRCFNAFLYAIDTVIPLVSLGQRTTWYPDAPPRLHPHAIVAQRRHHPLLAPLLNLRPVTRQPGPVRVEAAGISGVPGRVQRPNPAGLRVGPAAVRRWCQQHQLPVDVFTAACQHFDA
jgi:hypothetical protein